MNDRPMLNWDRYMRRQRPSRDRLRRWVILHASHRAVSRDSMQTADAGDTAGRGGPFPGGPPPE